MNTFLVKDEVFREKVKETAPEICFQAFNGSPMKYPKKSPEGFSERVKALKCICLDAEKIAESAFSKYRRNDPVYGWQWSRSCPLEAAGKTVGDYLQGYLEKSMSPQHGDMYWATGIRNWTCYRKA